METLEKIFIIPIEKKKAIFKFNPFYQLSDLLIEYNIPHCYCNVDDKIFKGKKYKVIGSEYQTISKYEVVSNNKIRNKYIFYFTSNIIDKVLDYYNVPYKKEMKNDKQFNI